MTIETGPIFRVLRRARLVAGAAVIVVLGACSATFNNHGYVPPPEDLVEVSVGDSREAVAAAIGSPGVAGVMGEDAWYYTAYRIRNFAYREPEVIERQVLAVSFDGRGRVANIEEFGLEDGRIVQFSRRVTTSTVRDSGFLRQIFANFGRINIADALSD